MDEYLQTLEVFYDQKTKYLTKKDKFIRCPNCENEKEFIEEKDKLQLSCGSKQGDCGPQIIIKLPKYIHYETKLDELRNSLIEEYNWDALQKFLDVGDKATKYDEKQKRINEEITRIERLFFEKNMKMKQTQLQTFYDQRIRKTKKCKEIKKELKKESLTEEQRKEFQREYIRNVQEINQEYEEIKELIEDINPFLMEEEPEVTIKHDSYEYKKVKKERVEEQLIEQILKGFIEKNGIITREDYIDMKEEGGFKTEWGSTLLNSLQKTKYNTWKKKEQEKYGSIIKEPESTNPDQIECSEKWMEYLTTKQFKKGMKVSWMYKEKKKIGTIKEIKGKGALVEDEKGKGRIRALKDLIMEKN